MHGSRNTVFISRCYNFIAAPAVSQEAVKLRPAFFRAREATVHIFVGDLPTPSQTVLPQFTSLNMRILAVIAGGNTRIDSGSHFLRAFRPGFCAAFTLRPFAKSPSLQRQSLRPSLNAIPWNGRILPCASHRLSVRNETPMRLAATCVLYVFFTVFLAS
jgi:hypothetical protein